MAAIRAFEAAARTENFTAAAAELGMTQAAVSYQVKGLEERLGAPLFVREKGRVKLTPLGTRLLPALSSAFDTIEAAFATHREEDESLLTITTTHTFANTWLAWRLGAFQIEHPELAVRMTTSNELVDLRSGDADVAIRAGRGDWEGHGALSSCSSRASRRWRAPIALPNSRPNCGRKIEPGDIPHQTSDQSRATTGGSNGSPTMECRSTRASSGDPAFASTARLTKAMRRWQARVSHCSPRSCGRATWRPAA